MTLRDFILKNTGHAKQIRLLHVSVIEAIIELTSHIVEMSIQDRLRLIRKDLTDWPVCPICGEKVKYQAGKFNASCSKLCGKKLEEFLKPNFRKNMLDGIRGMSVTEEASERRKIHVPYCSLPVNYFGKFVGRKKR